MALGAMVLALAWWGTAAALTAPGPGGSPPAGESVEAEFLKAARLRLLAVGQRHEVVVVTPGRRQSFVIGKAGDEVTEVTVSPLAGRIMAAVRTGCNGGRRQVGLWIIDVEAGRSRQLRNQSSSCEGEDVQGFASLILSPDGSRGAWATTGASWSGWSVYRLDGRSESVPQLTDTDSRLCRPGGEFAGGWPLAWSLDGRSLFAVDFEADGQTVTCVSRVDFEARTAGLLYVASLTDAGTQVLRGSLADLTRMVGPGALGLYGLSPGEPESLLEPLGAGLRRPKRLVAPDGLVRIERDWGDLVAVDARTGRELSRLPGVVPAPPPCTDLCIDPDDLWAPGWEPR